MSLNLGVPASETAGEPGEPLDLGARAARIGAAWRKGVAAILETGRLMAEAREALDDDDWSTLVVNLPFGARYAQMLVRIGADTRLTKHASLLPPDATILYRITQLSDDRFDDLRAADRIHPGMGRNDLDTVVKQDMRAAKERDLAECRIAGNEALGSEPEGKRYNVIYADPPWRLEPYSRTTGLNKAAENHYPTLSSQEIAALPVMDLAANDAVLFLWATVPMLVDACMTVAAWGFQYKSHFVWIKDKAGTGYWNRNRHELLLVGTRGNIPAPAPGTQVSSVIENSLRDRLRHSQKPASARAMIEVYYPSVPKIELFARPPVPEGWDAWGNEVSEVGSRKTEDGEEGEAA